MPYFDEINNNKFKLHFKNNQIYGCMAETMILAFDKIFENYSVGRGNITIEKINRLKAAALRHGFSVSTGFGDV